MQAPQCLYSRRVLTEQGLKPAAVLIKDGRIVEILPEAPVELHVEDLGERVLMPGLVDLHVHINEPGRTEWEGFVSATRAAAAGGITTVVDMPLNCIPVTTSVDALEAKLAAAAGKLWVDTAFWGGVVPGNAGELRAMVRAGVFGFKAFLCPSGIDDFPASTAADLRVAMPILRAAGVPLLAHAEIEGALVGDTGGDPREYSTYLHSRPPEWELAAIRLLIDLVRETGARVHIVHLSSAAALPMIAAAKAEGLPITVETCPHYLCLWAEVVPDGATEFKCAPPVREADNREALWRGLLDGTIDLVISDHSPCIPALKLQDQGDFMNAWGGIASLQLGLSNVWTEAWRRGAGVADLQRWMGRAPAALLGLGHKGVLKVGADADLVAWSPEASYTISAEILHHRHKLSPYLGRTVDGLPGDTWLAGRRVMRDGVLSDTPTGRVLKRGGAHT